MPSSRALHARGLVDVAASGWTRPAAGGEAATAPPFPGLAGDHRVDVAVVGAGLAGSSLALHLAEAGASVAVIEAREPGWGASGRNAGHVVSHREYAAGALASLPERGERFLALLRDAGDLVYGLARRHAIECDGVQAGYFMVSEKAREIAAAERKVELWQKLGFRLRMLGRDEAAKALGTQRFPAAAVDEAGGRINPWRFTQGLARAALRAGASVFARSPVTAIERDGARWRVRIGSAPSAAAATRAGAHSGTLRAERVVVCTNAYTTKLVPGLAHSFYPLAAYGLALAPLPEALRSEILPCGGAMMQLPTGFHPMLVDGHGRIVTSLLPGPLRPESPAAPLRDAQRWLLRTFPRLRGVPLAVESYWTGATAWSPDTLPRIFEPAPGLLSLGCFSGEGNAIAPALGRHLAEAIAKDDLPGLALPVSAPQALRFRSRLEVGLRWLGVPLLRLADRAGLY
jgi:glycine/D-amino acid oxidase-like deaminating enzyme